MHIWTAQPNGSLDYVTDRVAAYFGIPAEQLLAEGWKNVVHPDDLPIAAQRWNDCLKSGDRYEVEFRLRRHDGEYRWFLARALPQRKDDGTIVEWFGTNTDINEQRTDQA